MINVNDIQYMTCDEEEEYQNEKSKVEQSIDKQLRGKWECEETFRCIYVAFPRFRWYCSIKLIQEYKKQGWFVTKVKGKWFDGEFRFYPKDPKLSKFFQLITGERYA